VSVRAKPLSRRVQGATIGLSLALHAALVGGAFWIALRSLNRDRAIEEVASPASSTSSTIPVWLELPVVSDGVQIEPAPVDRTGDPPRVAGGSTEAHLDQASPGAGGDPGVTVPALNLADIDEHMRLSPDLINHLDRDQLQRLRVARKRQSWEDRRSTTHPTELTLIVTGPGTVFERRPDSRAMPSRGVERSPAPSVRGGEVGSPGSVLAGEGEAPRGGSAGSVASEPGAGIIDARPGLDHRASAPIASARPDVTEGPVSVPSRDAARARDDIDSEQEVATTVRSLVHASTAGGAPGEGQGGSAGGGEPGAGASEGSGSQAHPMGVGPGDVFEFWTRDPKLVPYFRQLHARIDPLWANAFPKAAALDGRQGTVILLFTVQADGQLSVKWPPVRPSGIDEFDRNCADALRRAAPLPPIPRELGVSSLTIRAPFVASNPVIR